MSTDYYFICDKCKVSSGCFHAQQAWGSWTDESAHEFLREHRDHEPIVVSEHDDRTSEMLSDFKRFQEPTADSNAH